MIVCSCSGPAHLRGLVDEARLNAMRVILKSVPYGGRNMDIDHVPDPNVVVSGAHDVEMMEADRFRRGRFKQ